MKNKILKILKDAKRASMVLSAVSTKDRNKALLAMADSLLKNLRYILLCNARDVSRAKKKGTSEIGRASCRERV